MPLEINCKINLILTWCADCIIFSETRAAKLVIADTKRYFLVMVL